MSEIDLTGTTDAKADQLNAVDILGEPKTITLTKGAQVSGDQPIALHYEGDNGKPYKPCKQMRRLIKHGWGNRFEPKGRKLRLYCDSDVTWGGDKVGGIRINGMSHIDKPFTHVDRASRHKISKYKVDALKVEAPIPEPEADEGLLELGEENASRGVEAYTEWLKTLDKETKATIKHMHIAWSKQAKEADNGDDFPAM